MACYIELRHPKISNIKPQILTFACTYLLLCSNIHILHNSNIHILLYSSNIHTCIKKRENFNRL